MGLFGRTAVKINDVKMIWSGEEEDTRAEYRVRYELDAIPM